MIEEAKATTEAEEAILDYCRKLRQLKEMHQKPRNYEYWGMEDFLLRHGRFFDVSKLKAAFISGTPKQCFNNSVELAVRVKGYRYVEGLALTEGLPLPVSHAWNVDAFGEFFYDCTWQERCDSGWKFRGIAYLGVEFSLKRAKHSVVKNGCSVLEDYRDRFLIYKEPWTGEVGK